jgi:hypothetical protein
MPRYIATGVSSRDSDSISLRPSPGSFCAVKSTARAPSLKIPPAAYHHLRKAPYLWASVPAGVQDRHEHLNLDLRGRPSVPLRVCDSSTSASTRITSSNPPSARNADESFSNGVQDSQGLSTPIPIPSKSATFLVATVKPCTSAVAAMRASRSERGLGT